MRIEINRVAVLLLVVCMLRSFPVAAQECGREVDFGVAADSWDHGFIILGADCGVVVQGNDVVTITNYNIRLFDRDGNLNQQRSRDTEDFVNDLGLDYNVDPFMVFDTHSERWCG